jgi:ABC-type glycerol-3-phosphate transport system permease component
MKFSTKQSNVLSNIMVSISMTIVMTGGMLLIHSGYCDHFFKLWLRDFLVGCCIAIPTGLVIVPIISKWFNLHTENKNIS